MISVCIPTMPQRASTLSRLLWHLEPHIGEIEVLIHARVAPMGDKLNELFAHAQGSHVVAVDDDDVIDVSKIGPVPDVDFIGWRILALLNGAYDRSVSHRLDSDPEADWDNTNDRGVSPKCLVRTEIARSVTFGNEYTADRPWSQAVHAKCTTSAFVDEHVYTYDHWPAAMLGTNPDDRPNALMRTVGWWPMDPTKFRWFR